MFADDLPRDPNPRTATLRMTAGCWDLLSGHVLADGDEHAALLVCGVASSADRLTFLVRDVIRLGDEDYLDRGAMHLSIAPITIARAAKQARTEQSTLVLVHSHPLPGAVQASRIDLATETDLCGRVLTGRTGLPTAALIIGPDGLDGRMWTTSGVSPLRAVEIVGQSIEVLPVSSFPLATPQHAPRSADPSTARQELLWGLEGQLRLREARVSIVGCGGTGSHVAQQLAHLRVGSIALIDGDRVEDTNLSRLIGATSDDVGRRKVDVVAEVVRRIAPDTCVEAVPKSVLDIDPRILTDADVIVCATDGHGSRALLTELVQQYLVPVVDLGVEVTGGDATTFRAGGGVRILRPDSGCLWCADTLNPELVRREYLTPSEREIEVRRGYIRDNDEPAPSVVALNGVVASMAVLEVCQLLVGMLGAGTDRVLYRAEARKASTAGISSRESCHVCGANGPRGRGDALRVKTRWRMASAGA